LWKGEEKVQNGKELETLQENKTGSRLLRFGKFGFAKKKKEEEARFE
jgi:translation initiation factor IF-3